MENWTRSKDYDDINKDNIIDPNTGEMRAVEGKWIELVDILYNTMLM